MRFPAQSKDDEKRPETKKKSIVTAIFSHDMKMRAKTISLSHSALNSCPQFLVLLEEKKM